jgi:TonB-dependent receptor
MIRKTVLTALLIIISILTVTAQQSALRGTVTDAHTGESIPGVTIFIEGTTTGTMTDFDGKFSLPLAPGIYDLRVSFISYETLSIKGLKIESGKITLLDNLRLKEAKVELNVVEVSAEAIRSSEASILTLKARTASLIDGISASNFRKIGDSDAASSIKRVPGISVEGGKYVFIRGLGDRYTKTMLNGLDIPGLDPDRNTLQMDIFPTNIIDNIIAYKTFTADLPADFTGGVLDITTKDFPEEPTASLSVNTTYNPGSHFNSNFLTYEGGKTDFLGFDDGTRDIPAIDNIPFFSEVVGNPNSERGQRYKEILMAFNPVLAAEKKQNLMDFGFGFATGNQYNRPKAGWGYNFSMSYKNETEFYQDADFSRYGLYNDKTATEFERREYQVGDYGISNVMLNGMAGLAYKNKNTKLRINILHLQNGESKAGIFKYEGLDKGSIFKAVQHNLEYSQRSLTNGLVSGKHFFGANKWEADWKISPTFSTLYDPDIRFTRYEIRGENNYSIGTETGFPERIWRELKEFNLAGGVNITRNFDFLGNKSKVQFGGAYTYKQREYIVRGFALNIRGVTLTGNPNELFFPENLWPLNGNASRGTTYEASFIPSNPNQFQANSNNLAGYASTEISPVQNLKTIVGLRLENFLLRYTGQDQLGTIVYENEKVLGKLDYFPSVNLIYSITAKMNLRLSAAKTIARPSFKEMSYAEIFDPISGKTFAGGLFQDKDNISGEVYWDGNLKTTDIYNFDLRWELFREKGQMASLSAFYKTFKNPIELVQYVQMVNAFQPRNVGDGQVIGLEMELRQNLGFLTPELNPVNFVSNVTVTGSRIQMSETELKSRNENARTGETIGEYRDMAGQAPFIVNAGLLFDGGEKGLIRDFEAALFYNMQGPTLQIVGIVDRPDIYSVPFHSLNLNANKKLGKNKKMQIGIKIDNLLNQNKATLFKAYNTAEEYDSFLKPGMAFQLRMQYNFF